MSALCSTGKPVDLNRYLSGRPTERIITAIRKQFPGKWSYSQPEHRWISDLGWEIVGESHLISEDRDVVKYRLRRFEADPGELVLTDHWRERQLG